MTKHSLTRLPAAGKPAKPYPDFPLFPHATKRWAKKIRGRLVYFGPWGDPDGALQRYLDQKDALHAGRKPADEELTVLRLCGLFLTTKKNMVAVGELSPHSFRNYERACKLLVRVLGKNTRVADLRPEDFERLRMRMARTWGVVRIAFEINLVHVVFNYAYKNRLIDKPMLYGEGFRRPSAKTLRKQRAERGPKMFTADEIRRMLAAASQPLKAMILLGVNCGFGNSDIGHLPLSALDVDGGWVTFARPKTGIPRRCPLWSETVAAIREWLAVRPAPVHEKDSALVFLTSARLRWAKLTSASPLSAEMKRLLDRLGVNGRRNFYGLRHTLQTVGDEARDFLAVRAIMGHVGKDIADDYRDRPPNDDRLRAVAEHVRGWLFGREGGAK